ncbi:hypothetical protein [uncultured Campylobacter sp.]|uniref:hypothetical protein n=1 Tax=uncultured Campylobacter sp. TaxID=218934 RepID=UPI002615F265|nr:hypothetical protein [uncultured Campylobacter sp.]
MRASGFSNLTDLNLKDSALFVNQLKFKPFRQILACRMCAKFIAVWPSLAGLALNLPR